MYTFPMSGSTPINADRKYTAISQGSLYVFVCLFVLVCKKERSEDLNPYCPYGLATFPNNTVCDIFGKKQLGKPD